MPFADFIKTTVLLSAAAATALAVATLLSARAADDPRTATIAVGWWAVSAAIGFWLGRRAAASPPIARLLRGAKTVSVLPPQRPARVVLSRLWPLLVSTAAAGGLAFLAPQIPAVATGFAIVWSLAWRQQHAAIIAIERRDGARFHVDVTSPWRPITLSRTPGFKAYLPAERSRAA